MPGLHQLLAATMHCQALHQALQLTRCHKLGLLHPHVADLHETAVSHALSGVASNMGKLFIQKLSMCML